MDERAVVIEKDTKGYGFNLSRLSDVHFVRVVEPTGAAYRAGARAGDRILKVNGQDVTKVSHANLVQLVKTAGNTLRMTLRQLAPDELARLQAEAKAAEQSQQPSAAPSASRSSRRLSIPDGCVTILLNKTDRGFGFNLSKIENKHVFRVVEPGGAADKAGAQPGDEIIMISNKPVVGLEHHAVVGLVKDAGASVEVVLRPRPSQQDKPVFLQHATGDTNADRLARAQQAAAEESARRMRQLELDRVQERESKRRQVFERERTRLQAELERALKNAELAKTAAGYSRNEIKAVASEREIKEMDAVLSGLAESSRNELKLKHKRALPEDTEELQLERLRRDLERAVLDDELYQVQKLEWVRFMKDCEKRREEDARDEAKAQAELASAREKDLQILQQKQARMTSMMEEAQRRREVEIEEARRRREEEMAARQREMQERLARSQAAAQAREEQLQRDRREAEARERREEEARAAREFEQAEARRKAEQRAGAPPEEEDEVPSFRTQLRKTSGPPAASSKAHPMIAQMAAQRKAGTAGGFRIPLQSGMSDTAM